MNDTEKKLREALETALPYVMHDEPQDCGCGACGLCMNAVFWGKAVQRARAALAMPPIPDVAARDAAWRAAVEPFLVAVPPFGPMECGHGVEILGGVVCASGAGGSSCEMNPLRALMAGEPAKETK